MNTIYVYPEMWVKLGIWLGVFFMALLLVTLEDFLNFIARRKLEKYIVYKKLSQDYEEYLLKRKEEKRKIMGL